MSWRQLFGIFLNYSLAKDENMKGGWIKEKVKEWLRVCSAFLKSPSVSSFGFCLACRFSSPTALWHTCSSVLPGLYLLLLPKPLIYNFSFQQPMVLVLIFVSVHFSSSLSSSPCFAFIWSFTFIWSCFASFWSWFGDAQATAVFLNWTSLWISCQRSALPPLWIWLILKVAYVQTNA